MHKALIETVNNPPAPVADKRGKQRWSTVMIVTVYGRVAIPYMMHGAALGHTGRGIGEEAKNTGVDTRMARGLSREPYPRDL